MQGQCASTYASRYFEGIESIVHSELTNQVLSPLYNIGIDVLVFEDDLERAKAILKEAFPEL